MRRMTYLAVLAGLFLVIPSAWAEGEGQADLDAVEADVTLRRNVGDHVTEPAEVRVWVSPPSPTPPR